MADLAELFRGRTLILLDFDGPVCAAFGASGGRPIADELRAFARSDGLELDRHEARDDPLGVLLAVANERPDSTIRVDNKLRELERRAIRSATPTAGIDDFLHAAAAARRTVMVATNNDAGAVHDYLADHHLIHLVAGVEGRPADEPSRMKPDPLVLEHAVQRAGQAHPLAIMIGDSPSDVLAARELYIPCIGLANKPGKDRLLSQTGAVAVAYSMKECVDGLTRS